MKKYIGIILAFFIALSALVSCRATPDTAIVKGKDSEKLLDTANASRNSEEQGLTLGERFEIPQSFSLNEEQKSLIITANDAPVTVPDTDKMPIINVSEAVFSQEQVDKYWEALIGGTEMWDVSDLPAKSDIELMITRQKQSMAEAELNGEATDAYEANIAGLERIYASAPETKEAVRSYGELRENFYYDPVFGTLDERFEGFNAASASPEDVPGESDYKYFQVINPWPGEEDGIRPYEHFSYMSYHTAASDKFFYPPLSEIGHEAMLAEAASFLKMTPDEAEEQVELFLRETSTPMIISRIEAVNDISELTGKPAAEHYAYEITCTREVEGLPVSDSRYSIASSFLSDWFGESSPYTPRMQIVEHSQIWDYESMSIRLDDTGIISFYWNAPLEIGETEVDDCRLLSFDEILTIFKKMTFVSYEPNVSDGYVMTWDVTEARLELVKVTTQNSDSEKFEGMLVPAWTFLGTPSICGGQGQYAARENSEDSLPEKIIVINAVDGSVIDMSAGY